MIGGAKGIGIGIDFGIPNQYCRATSKPYIEKDVLDSLRVVASAYGKSNDDADRSIVKNLVDASNPFIISNAAFKLNSGFGKYEVDFNSLDRTDQSVLTTDYKFIKISKIKQESDGNVVYSWGKSLPAIDSVKIRVRGLDEVGARLTFIYLDDSDQYVRKTYYSDGTYDLPSSSAHEGVFATNFRFAIFGYKGDCNITIEQIPSFEGAFVTDGVNDLITSTKTVQEMLGGSNELTIVSMIHQVKDSANNVSFTNYIRGSANGYFRNIVNNYGKTGIYGYTSSDLMGLSVVNNILGDKNDYTSNGDNRDSIINGNFSVQGYSYNDGNNTGDFSSVAWCWTIIANKVLTTDQINQVIAYFNLDRCVEPTAWYDVQKQGLTNETPAADWYLKDFSKNGFNMSLFNFAKKGNSGVGKYEVDFTSWTKSHFTDGVNASSSKIEVTGILTTSSILITTISTPIYNVEIHTPNKSIVVYFQYDDGTGINRISLVEGINELPSANESIFVTSDRLNSEGVTITQIPSHAGALCFDGVDDYGKVTGMPIYKDYTVVTDREIFANTGAISSKNNPGAFVETAGNSVYSFGQGTSGLNFISTRSISYLSKYSYCGQSITAGAAEDGTDMWLGTIRDNDHRFFNGAIYSLMSFPYSMSEFLIERQLKKHKLGTLYPDMVEFRPIVKSNVKWDIIEIWQGDKSLYRPTINDDKTGIYLKKDSTIGIYVKPYVGQKVSEIVYNGVSYTDLKLNSNGFYYITVPVTKSPQKIGITIEQDENYILFNPVINSNVEYHKLDFFLNNYQKRINIGDYIPKDAYLRANFYLKNNVDELTAFIFNGVNIGYRRSSVDDTAFNIDYIYNYDSPQEVNITIDEYIRYEDIVQPYPVIFQITDRNTNQRYSWGDKIKVGSSIRLSQGEKTNLLSGLYSIQSYEYEGETYSYNQLTDLNIILTKQSISLSCNKIWLLDNNEPKCILSPRLLRIPNSSYKILGYIPDISGHGNHGVIHNSAYAEGSGVNEDGSYQFDGVDDFVTIPTITGGKQVLMKVNWQSIAGMAILYDQRTNGGFAIFNRDYDTNENKVPAYRARNIGGNTYIDGILNEYIYASQLQNITHNIVELYDPELNIGTLNPKIGSSYLNANYAQMSLYDFMLFDEISTDDKIQELNEYVGIEAKVELPPYYWDAYGKTNLDADKATIQQRGVAVGDYDLINNNFAYEGMSGYNGYPVVFGASKTWANESNGYVSSITSNTIHITNVLNAGLALLYSYVKYNGNLQNIKEIPPFKIEIKGLEGRSKFIYKYLATSDATKETNLYLGNGTHELPKSFLPTEALVNDAVVGFSISPIEEGVTNFLSDITIEVLPEYENGLAYDGITDYSKNANIPVLTDYTYIYKRTIINIPTNAATLLKGADKTNGGAFIADYGNKWQFNFGQYNIIQGIADGINWQTVNSFNGTSINKGENTDDSGITVAKFSNGYTSMVFYKLILYPKTISLLEINFLKNLMEKDEIIDLTNPIFIQ